MHARAICVCRLIILKLDIIMSYRISKKNHFPPKSLFTVNLERSKCIIFHRDKYIIYHIHVIYCSTTTEGK